MISGVWPVLAEIRFHGVHWFQGQVNFGGYETRETSGNPMAKLNEYVKTAEAAAILGISQNSLRGWTDAGKIRCHRNPANGYRLFKRSELEKFLRTVEASGNKPPVQKKK